MKKTVPFFCLILLLAGCASSTSETSQNVAESEPTTVATVDETPKVDDLICYRYVPTGSHRSKQICRTREQINADREKAQERLDRNTRQTGAERIKGI